MHIQIMFKFVLLFVQYKTIYISIYYGKTLSQGMISCSGIVIQDQNSPGRKGTATPRKRGS